MKFEINENLPIHPQLVKEIITRIVCGIYNKGEKIPSVRDLAIEAEVNPNTMQKALTELEETKVIKAKGTSGRFVTEDETKINELRGNLQEQIKKEFIKEMKKLGYNNKEILGIVRKELSND